MYIYLCQEDSRVPRQMAMEYYLLRRQIESKQLYQNIEIIYIDLTDKINLDQSKFNYLKMNTKELLDLTIT